MYDSRVGWKIRASGALAVVLVAILAALAAPAGLWTGYAQAAQPKDVPFVVADPGSYEMREYPLPESPTSRQAQGRAHSITVAPDGRIWYSGLTQNNLGMFDPLSETFRMWDTPTPRSRPHGIQAAADGMIWVTITGLPQNKMARFDPAIEQWTEYVLPRPTP